jgi:GH43 family beta-xylosidase
MGLFSPSLFVVAMLIECRFFTSPDGTEIWNIYHATRAVEGACDSNRYTAALRVEWNEDGSPDLGSAPALGTVLDGPSGEPA